MTIKPKLSEELDEPTMKVIICKSKGASMQGNCSRCMAPLDGTHYDHLRDNDRICQVCKLLHIPRQWRESNP